MELNDGHITLRKPVDDDAPALDALITSSLAELEPFMPWATADRTIDDTLTWINGTEEETFVIVVEGVIVGACGLNQFNEVNKYANLGYWVATSCATNGYATRATRLLARYGFDHHGLARIEILMSIENEASRRVAEKSGARHEGVLRNRLLLHGRYHDAHLFSLVPGEV